MQGFVSSEILRKNLDGGNFSHLGKETLNALFSRKLLQYLTTLNQCNKNVHYTLSPL